MYGLFPQKGTFTFHFITTVLFSFSTITITKCCHDCFLIILHFFPFILFILFHFLFYFILFFIFLLLCLHIVFKTHNCSKFLLVLGNMWCDITLKINASAD